MAEETVVGGRGREVRDETVANVLIGVGALERAIVKILRRADESSESAVVESMRERVVGIQAEIPAESFDDLKGEPVIDGISGVIRVIEETGVVVGRTALRQARRTEKCLASRPAIWRCRCGDARGIAGSDKRHGDLWFGGAEGKGRADVEIRSANQMVRCDKHIAGAHGKSVYDF